MRKGVVVFLVIIFILTAYYQLDYKRDFIYSNDRAKVFTIWKRMGYNFYIIPGKYCSPFTPKKNYIYASNQYVGVVFDSSDSYSYKLSVFYKEMSTDFSPNIKIYRSNDSLLLEYKILDSIGHGKRFYHENKDSLRRALDYKYIDLNRFYGIKVFNF